MITPEEDEAIEFCSECNAIANGVADVLEGKSLDASIVVLVDCLAIAIAGMAATKDEADELTTSTIADLEDSVAEQWRERIKMQ